MPDINQEAQDFGKEIAKDIAKDVYKDLGQPVTKPTGELAGLVPRAIKAALAPLEKWVLQREYNVAETKKLLEEKLKNVSPENIHAPDPYIAVPALQYISYCMDNDELRNMYANLLANSMTDVVKNGVHPGFVEIIKQLSPDEAKILQFFSSHNTVPTITLRYTTEQGGGIDMVKNFSIVGEQTCCEYPFEVNKYFDNLIRLGLLEPSPPLSSLTNKSMYEALKTHRYVEHYKNLLPQYPQYSKTSIEEGFMRLTDYGISFCRICLNPTNDATVIKL